MPRSIVVYLVALEVESRELGQVGLAEVEAAVTGDPIMV
jgi:hypothetical protein